MRLRDIRDAIDSVNETEPWAFTGVDFLETLTLVRFTHGERVCTDGVLIPPFADDLEVRSDFFVVKHVGHVPDTYILCFPNLHDLERALVSDGGAINHFATHCFAFVQGALRRFRIFYKNQGGVEVVFRKAEQIAENNYSEVYADRRLEWV